MRRGWRGAADLPCNAPRPSVQRGVRAAVRARSERGTGGGANDYGVGIGQEMDGEGGERRGQAGSKQTREVFTNEAKFVRTLLRLSDYTMTLLVTRLLLHSRLLESSCFLPLFSPPLQLDLINSDKLENDAARCHQERGGEAAPQLGNETVASAGGGRARLTTARTARGGGGR